MGGRPASKSKPTAHLTLMNNFKFMDSWPAWVRWLLVFPVAGVCFGFGFVALGILATVLRNSELIMGAVAVVWSILYSAVFVWCGGATAPRFKLVVAALLGLALLFTFAAEKLPLFGMIGVAVGAIIALGLVL
jgi:hypothetical protein